MKRFLALILALTSFRMLLMASENPACLKIAENGRSRYSIVISTHASETETQAAQLIREYIGKVSGAAIPIRTDDARPSKFEFSIGNTSRLFNSPLSFTDPDAFKVWNEGKRIFITGGSHKGVYYGVVTLLEQYLGCAILAPGVEIVPKQLSLCLPYLNFSDKPANTLRIVHGSFNNDKAYKEWMRLDNINEIFADGYYVHTFNKLVPWQNYFTQHPEYYAFMNGKRIIDQLCVSNPDVLKIAIERLKYEMALQPGKKLWSVSQNDNFTYCQCDRCKAVIEEEGAPSGPLLRFVNAVAAQFPYKIISTLAYQFSRTAPKVTKPADNVQIMLCTIEMNRARSIESDPTGQSFVKDISDWNKLTSNIYLWDYTIDFAHTISPFPNLHVLQPNIQFFTRNGACQHFQQTNTMKGNEMSELKSYLLARLLWNPHVNLDSVKSVFLKGFYGPAAPYISRYLERLESELIRSGEWLDIYGPPTDHEKSFLSAENIEYYDTLFDAAEKAVAGDTALLQRVKVSRLPLQYAAMEIGKNDMFGPRGWYSETGGSYIQKQRMASMLEDFYTVSNQNGIRFLNESALTVESYYRATKRFIDVQVENNKAFRKKATATPLPSPKYSRGDLSVLTNGVQGAENYKVHWLGWEGTDCTLTLDLGKPESFSTINVSTLWDPKSWILHPAAIRCMVSADNNQWNEAGYTTVEGNQHKEPVTRGFIYTGNFAAVQFIRFEITATKSLPAWHPSAGGLSWVFVDEITVK